MMFVQVVSGIFVIVKVLLVFIFSLHQFCSLIRERILVGAVEPGVIHFTLDQKMLFAKLHKSILDLML